MNLYSVYDRRAMEYTPPMAMPTDAHAVRSFTQEVNRADTGNNLNQFPEDFAMMKIGEFNQDTGAITPHAPTLVLEASAAKRPA